MFANARRSSENEPNLAIKTFFRFQDRSFVFPSNTLCASEVSREAAQIYMKDQSRGSFVEKCLTCSLVDARIVP